MEIFQEVLGLARLETITKSFDNNSVKILKKINSHVSKVISELINQPY